LFATGEAVVLQPEKQKLEASGLESGGSSREGIPGLLKRGEAVCDSDRIRVRPAAAHSDMVDVRQGT